MTKPGGIILEPNERVVLATRPLFLWEPLLLADLALVIAAVWIGGRAQADGALSGSPQALVVALLVAAALLLVWMVVRWIPWSRRWYVLTDRRVIVRWGVLNRTQAALLLDRIQDASLSRPFPLSLIRDYGVLRLESAGERSEERISAGLRDLPMTGASRFYRALTDAQTPT